MPKASTSTTLPYRCTECGWRAAKWVGRCSECQQWGTVQEAGERAGALRAVQPIAVSPERRARPIGEIPTADARHRTCGIGEFDRVLGGGLVPGAAILLSGEPGVGKSTLLLEVASRTAGTGARVLYVTAEESVGQVRVRAERTGALRPELYLAAETDLAAVLGHIEDVDPQLLVVDSVQTVASADADGIAGGPSQVREVASTLIRVAKERNLPLLLVGHVTKDGSIAGPRLLEHLVDVVCTFEGDRQTALRFVRALKNRFGPTDEVGCFEMNGVGLAEVPDPSAMFLSRNPVPVSGTCTTVAMEGRRALPVEVQALVVPTSAPQPRRVTNGLDSSRVAMLLAVLERRAGVKLAQADVYVSTVGGVRLTEPAADLAIALAIASAAADSPVPGDLVAVGEISLAGEIRPVSSAKQREAEAERMGFGVLLDDEMRSARAAVEYALSRSASTSGAALSRSASTGGGTLPTRGSGAPQGEPSRGRLTALGAPAHSRMN